MSTAMAEMGAKHKVVIQVSSADAKTQTIALNNAVNVQKHFGPGEADVEIVAYGPGLSILTQGKKNKNATRVKSLAMSDITFSACGNTMKKVAKKKGKEPKLVEGVKVVPAGVVRIMELQGKGYSYIRP
jgi:intracellular sulfur oxidation DsrE/DsrF family protein